MANPTHFDGDLRAELVRAGVEVLKAEGLAGLTLRAVARRAGVSHAAPAHHVGDRAGLIAAIALHGQALMAARMAQAAAAAPDPVATIVAGVRTYLGFAHDEPELFAVMFRPELWEGHPEVADALDAGLAGTTESVRAAQALGWAAGADASVVATAVWSLAHGLASLRATGAFTAAADLDPAVVLDLLDPARIHRA